MHEMTWDTYSQNGPNLSTKEKRTLRMEPGKSGGAQMGTGA